MFGLHERPLTYDISSPGTKRSKYKKGKDLTNQTVKPRWAWPKTRQQTQPSHLQISLSLNRHTSSRGGDPIAFFFINNTTCGFQGVPVPHAHSPIWIRACPRLRLYWSGSKLFDTLTFSLKIVFENDKVLLKNQTEKGLQNYPACKSLHIIFPLNGKLGQHMWD